LKDIKKLNEAHIKEVKYNFSDATLTNPDVYSKFGNCNIKGLSGVEYLLAKGLYMGLPKGLCLNRFEWRFVKSIPLQLVRQMIKGSASTTEERYLKVNKGYYFMLGGVRIFVMRGFLKDLRFLHLPDSEDIKKLFKKLGII
jgi:hypothetical protein